MPSMHAAVLSLALAWLAAPRPAPAAGQWDLGGEWRAWLESPGGELPFGLVFATQPEGGTGGWIVNGAERIPLGRVERLGEAVILHLAPYDARVTAELSLDGRRLSGAWRKRRGAETWTGLRFEARRGAAPRFIRSGAAPELDLTGRWAADFASDELPAVGELAQAADGTLAGTFLTATGDYRYLAGSVEGRRLRLSCFDGAHAFLFDARARADGTLVGDFWSGESWHETWSARRDPQAALPDPFRQTSWDGQASLADLVYPDLAGVPRSLADPAFAGRARLVQLFGSWCPNCNDEAAYLAELDRRYRARGLSIVGVAFELSGDFARDAGQLRAFAAHHRLEYPLLLAGVAGKDEASAAFPAIDRLRSYPTTLFFDASGRVRSVHSGFAGPATGAEHARLRAHFEALIEELLAEAPPSDGETWSFLAARSWFSAVEFAGATYAFLAGADGARRAQYSVLGSGVPVLSTEELPVELVLGDGGDAVRVGQRILRLDRAAEVLIDPRDFGARLTAADGGVSPLLARRGFADEAGWVRALAEPDSTLRREALVAVARERSVSAGTRLPEALPLLQDPALDVRLAAVWAAGQVGEPEAAEPLLRLLSDPNAAVRRESVLALARLARGDAAAQAQVAALSSDPDPLVREAVRRALAGG